METPDAAAEESDEDQDQPSWSGESESPAEAGNPEGQDEPDDAPEASEPEDASEATDAEEAPELAEAEEAPELAESEEAFESVDDAPEADEVAESAPQGEDADDPDEGADDPDEAPEPPTDSSDPADDAPERAVDGPDLADEARESPTDALGSTDEAPEPTAPIDAPAQSAPVDEASDLADEASERADDAPEPPAPVDVSEPPSDVSDTADDAPDTAVDGRDQADESEDSAADALGPVDEAAEWYGNDALRDGRYYQKELDDQLAARGLDPSEHDKLRLSPTNDLSDAQAREVVGVRDAIKLDDDQMVTKVITPEKMQAYMHNVTKLGTNRTFNRGAFEGSIARGCDTADLRSMDQLRDGLALDDGGAGWSAVPPGASEAYQLRFPAPHDMRAEPSFGAVGDEKWANHVAGMAGQSRGRAWEEPFLGTGYTGGGVPEWIAKPTGFPHHAEIWRMHADGTEEAIGFFDKNEGLWKKRYD
ncbi:hypothetical protein GCM10020000_34850 [Streptomyces olivoverticillatus]